MGNRLKYQLELNDNWKFYNGARFEKYYDSKYFQDGMILRKENNKRKKYFYLKSGGLVPLEKYEAYRKIILYTIENSTTKIGTYYASKRKTLLILNIGNNEKIEYIVRKCDKILKIIEDSNSTVNDEIYQKSINLLLDLVKKDRRISMKGKDKLVVLSKNGKSYTIHINTGTVESSDGRYLCVHVPFSRSKNFGKIDIVIAKALTVTHLPEKIYTL